MHMGELRSFECRDKAVEEMDEEKAVEEREKAVKQKEKQ
jgi:hypothetical protein